MYLQNIPFSYIGNTYWTYTDIINTQLGVTLDVLYGLDKCVITFLLFTIHTLLKGQVEVGYAAFEGQLRILIKNY
jgi:hypothetical protein